MGLDGITEEQLLHMAKKRKDESDEILDAVFQNLMTLGVKKGKVLEKVGDSD